jgi:hypothetical protein
MILRVFFAIFVIVLLFGMLGLLLLIARAKE